MLDRNNAIFYSLYEQPFFKAIQKEGGDECICIVGGCVRDYILRKKPKDIDLMVRNIPYDNLLALLNQYGTVNLVGDSFGVLKFKTFNEDYDVEIALPRVDTLDKELKGHKAIIAQSDHNLTFTDDLKRRDFTCNSICLQIINNEIVFLDPFDGKRDIKERLIRQVDKDTFADDPLRMLRAVQFAARFYFTIDYETTENILENAELIKTISKERILEEFQKVIDKDGDIPALFSLLNFFKLDKHIFGFTLDNIPNKIKYITKINTFGEFLFIFCYKHITGIADFCKENLKISNHTYKEIKALEKMFEMKDIDNTESKFKLFEAFQTFEGLKFSSLLQFNIHSKYFDSMTYPRSLKDLNISGDRLMNEFGLKGKEISDAYMNILKAIFVGNANLKDPDDLLKYIK